MPDHPVHLVNPIVVIQPSIGTESYAGESDAGVLVYEQGRAFWYHKRRPGVEALVSLVIQLKCLFI